MTRGLTASEHVHPLGRGEGALGVPVALQVYISLLLYLLARLEVLASPSQQLVW